MGPGGPRSRPRAGGEWAVAAGGSRVPDETQPSWKWEVETQLGSPVGEQTPPGFDLGAIPSSGPFPAPWHGGTPT